MLPLILVVAVLTLPFTGLPGAIVESCLLTMLSIGATVWAVVLGALVLDARGSIE
jgi:hypothetical protein